MDFISTQTSPLLHSVKVIHGSDIRRFSVSSVSFQEMDLRVRQLFCFGNAKLVFKYQDEDQDWISVSSDQELKTAFDHFGNPVLRLTVEPLPADAPSSSSLAFSSSLPSLPLYPVLNERPVEGVAVQMKENGFASTTPVFSPAGDSKQLLSDKKAFKVQRKMLKLGFQGFRFVSDRTIPDGTCMTPGASFTKIWRIRNESGSAWPACSLVFRKGDPLGASEQTLAIPSIQAGQEFDISLPLRVPHECGKYTGVWRLTHPSVRTLGAPLKVKIRVPKGDGSSDEDALQDEGRWLSALKQLEEMGFVHRKKNLKLLARFGGDVQRVAFKLAKKAHRK